MISRFLLIVASSGTLVIAAVAQAHPGHGEPGDDFGLVHYLTEPLHVGLGTGLVMAAACIWKLVLRSIRHRRRAATTG